MSKPKLGYTIGKRYVMRRITNDGCPAKIYITHLKSQRDDMTDAITITKLVLSIKEPPTIFPVIKRYKNKILTREHISIRPSTLEIILTKYNNDN